MKERVATGTAAAARGGYTDVCSMPNLNPVPDTPETLKKQLDIIESDAVIGVHPYGSITKMEAGLELADLEGMADILPEHLSEAAGYRFLDRQNIFD